MEKERERKEELRLYNGKSHISPLTFRGYVSIISPPIIGPDINSGQHTFPSSSHCGCRRILPFEVSRKRRIPFLKGKTESLRIAVWGGEGEGASTELM